MDLEEDTSRLQAFLKFNYITLVLQSHFIVIRARPILLSMQIVETDLCIRFLFGATSEKIGFKVCSQNSFPDECLQETFSSITETSRSSENQQMLNLVKTSSQSAEKKFLKYFHETSGIYPALQFLR